MYYDGYTPSHYQIEEEMYFHRLQRYLKENYENSEQSFLVEEIKKLSDEIKELDEGDDRKSSNIKWRKKFYEIKLKRLPLSEKQDSQSKNPLVDGKKLNISERYKIAIEILDIYNIISKKNISATEKHILLAHILGCNKQTARELFNGTHIKRTSIREDLINSYLKNLK